MDVMSKNIYMETMKSFNRRKEAFCKICDARDNYFTAHGDTLEFVSCPVVVIKIFALLVIFFNIFLLFYFAFCEKFLKLYFTTEGCYAI